jgi:hypothetical protein
MWITGILGVEGPTDPTNYFSGVLARLRGQKSIPKTRDFHIMQNVWIT